MKRFHVHIAVDNLAANIKFYSHVFGQAPDVRQADYAKWMLADPRVNFAISQRGAAAGLDHLGIQVDSDTELQALRRQIGDAAIPAQDEPGTACCYSESDKYWLTDPQGIAWETFHTLKDIPVFGRDRQSGAAGDASKKACCTPAAQPIAFVKAPAKTGPSA